VVVTKGGCSAADTVIYSGTLKRDFVECTVWRKAAWQHIRDLKPAAVVMSSLMDNGFRDGPQQPDTSWAAAWTRSIDEVSGPGTRVFYINDTPWPAEKVPECLSARPAVVQSCGGPRDKGIRRPERRRLIADEVRARGVTVIDPLPWFCTREACPVIVGNLLVYKDHHHVTTAYSRLLAPLLQDAMGWPTT
jgi:hypothetical protein